MCIAPIVYIGLFPVTCSVMQVIGSPCPAVAARVVDNPDIFETAIGAESLIVGCLLASAVDKPVTFDSAIGAESLIVACLVARPDARALVVA